jgi:GntR family transcriptional regulator
MAIQRLRRLQLDFRSGLPAYLQIVRHVQRQAAAGALRAGDRLPTVRLLADELGLNFNTAARAYRVLSEAGVVSTQRGRGTYIIGKVAAPSSAVSRRAALVSLADEYVEAARRHKFMDAEILAILRRRLSRPGSSGSTG